MSSAAAVRAARDRVEQPGTMQSCPARQTITARNSAAQSPIATRLKSGGALTVGKNRNAPKVNSRVSAIVSPT